MARDEAKALIKAEGVRAALVRGELDKLTLALPALVDRPFEHLSAQPCAARTAGDAHAFNLAAPLRVRAFGNVLLCLSVSSMLNMLPSHYFVCIYLYTYILICRDARL